MSGSGAPSPTEVRARRRLEPFLGPLVMTDVPGELRRHDLGPADGSDAHAVEVTSDRDGDQLAQMRAARKAGVLDLGTARNWHLYLRRRAKVKALVDSSELRDLLRAAERDHVYEFPTVGRPPGDDPASALEERFAALHVEYARSYGTDSPGVVQLTGGMSAAWGGQGERVDRWWESFSAGPLVTGKVAKLRQSGAARTHLYVQVDTSTEDGLSISTALDAALDLGAAPYALPTFTPPDGVTDLWIWPDAPGDGLHYLAGTGWQRVSEDGRVRPG